MKPHNIKRVGGSESDGRIGSLFQTAVSTFLPSIQALWSLHALYAILYEIVFVLAFGALFFGLESAVMWQRAQFNTLPLDKEAIAQSPALLEAASSGLKGFVAMILLILAIFALCFALLCCLFNALIWARLKECPPNLPWVMRWIQTTLPATGLWIILFVIMTIIFKQEWYIVTVPLWFFLALYAMTCLHLTLSTDETARGWQAIKHAIFERILRPKNMFFPFLLWLASYAALTFLLGLMMDMTRAELLTPYLVVMTIWLRNYLLLNGLGKTTTKISPDS